MAEPYVVLNNAIIPEKDAFLHITDLAIQRGYGIFDFFRTVDNIPLYLEDHLDRFFASARAMHLKLHLSRQEIKDLLLELIEKNNIPVSGIKIILTGGYSSDGYGITKGNLIMKQYPFSVPENSFEKGIRLLLYAYRRQFARVKTIDYITGIHAMPLLKEKNADDVLYFYEDQISECPRANFFIVTEDGSVLTPEKHVLEGITRKKILDFKGFSIQQTSISPTDVLLAKEAFITSSTKNILPVTEINGLLINNGKPGNITRSLAEELQKDKQAYISLQKKNNT